MKNPLNTEDVVAASRHLWQSYFHGEQPDKPPMTITHGDGLYIYDAEGNEYLDTFASLLTTLCGHGRTEVIDAVTRQMEKLAYFPGGQEHVIEPAARLAAKLAEIAPGRLSVSFLVNDGSEANEAAIKLARSYYWAKGEKNRYKVIFRRGSYHGATLGALSATGLAGTREPYEPLLPGFTHAMPANCYRCELDLDPDTCALACLKNLASVLEWEGPQSVAAVIMDPIPGSNTGFPLPPDGYLQGVRDLCDRHGVLLIFDEIQTGFGRTGRMFACENWNVTPDIMTVAKGFSGGYVPIGAAIATEEIAETIRSAGTGFRHIHTFSGHAAACAAALAHIEIIQNEDLVQRAADLGDWFKRKLDELYRYPLVGNVRGLGTLWAVELVGNRETRETLDPQGKAGSFIADFCRKAGMILRNNGDILVLAPALVMTYAQADRIVNLLHDAIDSATGHCRQIGDRLEWVEEASSGLAPGPA